LKVAFNYQIFTIQSHGGVSRYFAELARCLSGYEQCEVRVLAMLHQNLYLSSLPRKNVIGAKVPIPPKTGPLAHVLNRQIARCWLSLNRPEILHETYYSSQPLLPRRSGKTVVTVFDMIHEKFPDKVKAARRVSAVKAAALRRADRVICISDCTRSDLLDLIDIPPERVSVTHLGYSRLRSSGIVGQERQIQPPEEPYLLYVGQRHGYKNFDGLLQAVASSNVLREFKLVCMGGGRLQATEQKRIKDLGLAEDSVVQVSGDDERLANLYSHASAFVYPSLYEGFGMPPLEAMSLGCPVVSSDQGSLPEVMGSAAQYFDPIDTESMSDALEAVLLSEARASELRFLGFERAKRYSWERCAEETLSVYKSLLS
jgi:glycosyltransferase involved in cell wall biosynthesis